MTLRQLVREWRERINGPVQDQVDAVTHRVVNQCADELASTLAVEATKNCGTCKFAGAVNDFWRGRQCNLAETGLEYFAPNIEPDPKVLAQQPANFVPLEVNGQPFSCSAWAASPPLEGTK